MHVCSTSCFHSILRYAPEMLSIRAPLNRLCGHVYAHLTWPNYNNHCCRQQIKACWDEGYLSGRKCPRVTLYLPKVHALISKQFQYQILKVLGLQMCFPWPNYANCYSLRECKYLNGPGRSSWSIELVLKIATDADYICVFLNCSFWWCCHYFCVLITLLIIAKGGQCKDAYMPENVQIEL